jgi:hypothetical protein
MAEQRKPSGFWLFVVFAQQPMTMDLSTRAATMTSQTREQTKALTW